MEIMTISEILIEITGGKEPLMDMKEVAQVMQVEPPTAYGYRSGVSEPKWKQGVALSLHLIDKHDYSRLGMQALLTSLGGKVNGCVDDECLVIVEAISLIRQGFDEGDNTTFQNGMGKLSRAYENLKAEGDKNL